MQAATNHPQQSNGSSQAVSIKYIKIPPFRDSEDAAQFDKLVFACDPNLGALFRHCSPAEYAPGQFAQMCAPGKQLLKLVFCNRMGVRIDVGLIYQRPVSENPEEFCAGLQTEPAMIALLTKLKGRTHENN